MANNAKLQEQDRTRLNAETTKAIENYLAEANNHSYYSESIQNALYVLLNDTDINQSLQDHMLMVACALKAIAISKASPLLRDNMGDSTFEEFCCMLERLISFFHWVRDSPANLARLELTMWEMDGATDKWPDSVVIKTKQEYEMKLRHLLDEKN